MLGKGQKWLLAVGLASISVLAAIRVVKLMKQRGHSKSWPMAQGRIIHSQVLTKEVLSTHNDGPIYIPKVTYTYTINGQEFSGHRIEWLDEVSTNSRFGAEKVIAKYPIGQLINVFYDPADPASAVLEPWRMKGIGIGIVIAVVTGLGSVLLAWIAYTDAY